MPRATDVDDYIAHAPDVTRPLLVALRKIIQKASPKLEEGIKWNIPCYEYKGQVIGFSASKSHVTWGLWKARLIKDPQKLIGNGILNGGKITTLAEVPPPPALVDLIRQVIALNEAGTKDPGAPEPQIPDDFATALNTSTKASKQFVKFSNACKWQYVNWITQAKRPDTRAKRIASAVEMIAEGKTMK